MADIWGATLALLPRSKTPCQSHGTGLDNGPPATVCYWERGSRPALSFPSSPRPREALHWGQGRPPRRGICQQMWTHSTFVLAGARKMFCSLDDDGEHHPFKHSAKHTLLPAPHGGHTGPPRREKTRERASLPFLSPPGGRVSGPRGAAPPAGAAAVDRPGRPGLG